MQGVYGGQAVYIRVFVISCFRVYMTLSVSYIWH